MTSPAMLLGRVRRCALLSSRPKACFTSKSSSSMHSQPIKSVDAQLRPRHRFVRAMHEFYYRENHFAVPYQFTIPTTSLSKVSKDQIDHTSGELYQPWPEELQGMKLGARLHRLMRSHSRDGADPSVIRELEHIGFPVSNWNNYYFETALLPALENYRNLYGDCRVLQPFIVPYGDPAWPRSTWNLRLGQQVRDIRRYRKISEDQARWLDEIGFLWSAKETTWRKFMMPGLRLYKEIHGHANVPLKFTVPREEPWPEYMHNYRLGKAWNGVRNRGSYADFVTEQSDELRELGFSFDLQQDRWDQLIMPALRTFYTKYGHLDVPQTFQVPSSTRDSDDWPEGTNALELGEVVKRIRQGQYKEQSKHDEQGLDNMGFVWNATQRTEMQVFAKVLPAMRYYKKLHGHMNISTDFVVPDHAPWPLASRGLFLGEWIKRVRGGRTIVTDKAREALDDIGFSWRLYDSRWERTVLPAFKAYAQKFGSCADMPTRYVVPAMDPFPPNTWGLHLGGALWHIRNGDTFVADPEKRAVMRELKILRESDKAYTGIQMGVDDKDVMSE